MVKKAGTTSSSNDDIAGISKTAFIVVMSVIFVAVIVGGIIGWSLLGALLLFIPWKRTKPRGFIPHLAWRWGLARFRNYPGPTQTRFFE